MTLNHYAAEIKFDESGQPVTLAAAALDAHDWLVQLYNADLSLLPRPSKHQEAKHQEAMERLGRCVKALQGFLTPLIPDEALSSKNVGV